MASSTTTPSKSELDALLQTGVMAAKQAGDIILENANGMKVMKSKANSRDLLTVVDGLCEKVRFVVVVEIGLV